MALKALCAILLLAFVGTCLSAGNIYMANNKLIVNGAEFIVKGLGYSPTPNGRSNMAGSGYGGTGLCSAKVTPWNEWKSACYDSDYFDGSPDIWNSTRFPDGFAGLWKRDFPLMKQTGANTIRLYNTNPSTKAATETYTNLFYTKGGKDHTRFMKMCEDYGFMVIYPLFSDNNLYATLDSATFKRYLRWQIDEVGGLNSLLMFQLGNEMDWTWRWNSKWNDPAAAAKYNDYVAYIRKYTLAKHGRVVPVTNGLVNDRQALPYQYANLQLDIFSANVFGTDFGSLLSGDNNWQGTTRLGCQYNRPFLMTEIGHTYVSGVQYPQGSFNQIWRNVVNNIPNGLIGAVYFEQTDEPALGKNFGLWAVQTQYNADGTNSNQDQVWTPDAVVPKQQFYDIVNGTFNGYTLNMNSNMYQLLGRAQYTASNTPNYCSSYGTYYNCPSGNTYQRCSGVGNCDRTSGTCTCMPGWSGSGCQTPVCPGSPSCSGRGVCSASVSPPECLCNKGYYGSQCELTVQQPNGTCPNGCSGNGICNPYSSICKCHPGWVGDDCRITDFGKGSLPIQQNYVSCYKTASNPATISVTLPALTNQQCMNYCAVRNFAYAETTAGNTCNCANLNPAASPAQTKYTSSCTLGCVGDLTQRCGGSGYSSVYRTAGRAGVGYIGCYVDDGSRDLPIYVGNTNDVDSCRPLCAQGGYTYAGLQAGGQCFCGNSYGRLGRAAESDCSWACADTSVICGAGWRNSIYLAALPQGYAY